MAEEESKDILEALRDRLKDPFLFAFAIALVAHNWQAFYIVVCARERTTSETISAAEAKWNGLGIPLLVALGFTLGYPFLRAAFASARTWILVQEQNLRRRIELGRKMTLLEMRAHEEFRELGVQLADMREYVKRAYQHMDPDASKRGAALVHVFKVVEPIAVPRFVRNLGRDEVGHFSEIPSLKDGSLLFAFDKVGSSHVAVAMPGALVPWPERFEESKFIVLASMHTMACVELPTPDAGSEILAVVKRIGDGRWGRFEINEDSWHKEVTKEAKRRSVPA